MVAASSSHLIKVRVKQYTWYTELVDLIDESYRKPFDYGTFDCALWGADAMRVQFEDGWDIAAPWRGQYKSLKEGMRLIKDSGYVSYVDVFERELLEIHPAKAQSGDLVVVDGIEGMHTIGVVVRAVIYAPTPTHLGILPYHKARRAFAVGRVTDD